MARAKAPAALGFCKACSGAVYPGQQGDGLALTHAAWSDCAAALANNVPRAAAPRTAWMLAHRDYEGWVE